MEQPPLFTSAALAGCLLACKQFYGTLGRPPKSRSVICLKFIGADALVVPITSTGITSTAHALYNYHRILASHGCESNGGIPLDFPLREIPSFLKLNNVTTINVQGLLDEGTVTVLVLCPAIHSNHSF